jgi:HlyD family secretion protein
MDVPKPKRNVAWFDRRMLLIAAVAVAVVVGALTLLGLGDARPHVARADLWIDVVRRGEMLNEIRASGSLIPKHVRWIAAETEGTVQEVLVLPGARVTADTVIIRMSNPVVLSKYELERAAHAGAEADVAVKTADLQLRLAEQNAALAKAESAYELSAARAQAQQRAEAAGAVSKMELRQSEIGSKQDMNALRIERERSAALRRSYEAQMLAIRADGAQAASALALARRQIEALDVRAGIDGILQQMDTEPGRKVEAGASLARVARQDVLIARLLVPESQAKDLQLGLTAQVDLRSAVVLGNIERIDPAVKDGRVAVDVTFKQPLPAGARPDLSVEGRIVVARIPDTLHVKRPAQANPNSVGRLLVIRDNGVAEQVEIEFGAASGERIQIKRGLRPGDRVVLSDTSRWSKYDSIKID